MLFVPLPRLRARSRSSSSRKTDVKRTRKSRKRRRRRSYSPLKKRRRDSPSHLEARRITRLTPPPFMNPHPFLSFAESCCRINVALELADEYFLTCQMNKLWNQATEQTLTTCGVPTKAGANPSERSPLINCFTMLTLANISLSEHLRPFPHHRRSNSWADFNPTASARHQIPTSHKCLFFLPPSARKRPIPYFRPSPSSISRSTSISSWSSIFTRSRSRSRSQSYSSYGSYSRSSSWNSVFGSCSRSRSRERNRSRH